jgi:SAM-dependent methyltransferase
MSLDFEYYKGAEQVARYESKRFGGGGGFVVHHVQLAIIKELIRKRAPQAFLDVPVGTGRIVRSVSDSIACVVGVDVSWPMIQHSRTFEAPFKDNSFDIVVCLRFIRHLEKDGRRLVYQEMNRVLKPGGVLVFDAVPAAQEFDYLGQRQYSGRIYDVLYKNQEELGEEVTPFFAGIDMYGVLHFPVAFMKALNALPFRGVRDAFMRTVTFSDPLLKRSIRNCQEWLVVCNK